MFSKKLVVGVLCPFSTTYPQMPVDFMHGLMCGLPQSLHNEIDFLPEYTRQGQSQTMTDALQKLYGFHQADMVTGPISYKTLPYVLQIVESSGKLALFTDLGEYLPNTGIFSEFVFNNSFQYWQAEFAKGVWAQQEYGDRGAVMMPLYESGYHMHSAFRHGTEAAGSEVVDYIVIPHDIKKEKEFSEYVEQLVQHFKKQGKPSYLNVLFSGKDATQCLKILAENSYFNDIPLLVSPHMSSPEMLDLVKGEHLTFYSASMWSVESTEKENKIFREKYIARTGTMANVFSLLGYETGIMIGIMYPLLKANLYAEARKVLKNERIKTPRGERSFNLDSDYALPQVDIEKIQTGDQRVSRMVISQGQAMPYNHQVYREIHEECVTGWNNPYLCI